MERLRDFPITQPLHHAIANRFLAPDLYADFPPNADLPVNPEQKYVLVTGATRGIGRAVARRFAQAGFGVLAHARTAAALEVLKLELATDFPQAPPALAFAADLSKVAAAAALADWLTALPEAQVPTVVVHNAGQFVLGGFADEPAGTLDALFQLHVGSVYTLTRALLPRLAVGAHVFAIGSTAALGAYPKGVSYCITKHALRGLMQVLREEGKARGLRVTTLHPGPVLTDSWAGAPLPPDRLMPPEDVADALWAAWATSPRTVVEEIVLRPLLGDLL